MDRSLRGDRRLVSLGLLVGHSLYRRLRQRLYVVRRLWLL